MQIEDNHRVAGMSVGDLVNVQVLDSTEGLDLGRHVGLNSTVDGPVVGVWTQKMGFNNMLESDGQSGDRPAKLVHRRGRKEKRKEVVVYNGGSGRRSGAPPSAMRIFRWNCQNLGRPRTLQALKDAVRAFSPQIICFMETKKEDTESQWIKWKLGFHNYFLVGCRGRSGGLAILWMDSIDIRLLSFSRNHIDVVVKEHKEFRLTLFYGEPTVSNGVLGSSLLRRLGEDMGLPWVVVGDFNEVVCALEVQGAEVDKTGRWIISGECLMIAI
ncbi:hypothetical protein QQ045_032298 [Rhodiola kirilowii]